MAGERKVRSFSLNTEEDKDILERLEELPNISDYIKRLIREDISSSPEKMNLGLSMKVEQEFMTLIVRVC